MRDGKHGSWRLSLPYMRRGPLSIYYETQGSGFRLLLFPPGGMNATIDWWGQSAFNPMEIFSREYWTITLDQRNAGKSVGPLDVEDPWGSYAEYSSDVDYIPVEHDWKAGDHPPEDSFYVWGPTPPEDFAFNHEAAA